MAASETVKCVDAFAAPSRARAQVLQLKSKIEQAMRTSAWDTNFRHPITRCPRVGSISHCGFPHRPYTKVIEAKKQHLSFRGKKLDDDAATLETIGIAPDYTLRTQSVTVSDK